MPTTILLAGATGSGKSKTFCRLQKMNTKANTKIVYFSEVATEVLATQPREFCEDNDKFQTHIAKIQLAQLNSKDSQQADIIIADRGLPDFYVFHEIGAKKFFESEAEAFSYYDYVFFFQPFALDDVLQGNVYRKEKSLHELKDNAKQTENVYKRYPNPQNMFIVPNFPTIEEKALYCANMINKILNDQVFVFEIAQ